MLKLVFVLLCLTNLALSDQGVNWALLVAGSNEYYNYRHQADICHAYQILHKNGIPDERIVVMMYDDIAENRENPFKGTIINKPNGPDVYKGTLKDYTKREVSPQNFINILQGKSDALKGLGSGKTINSGPNDNVFVYFADHGAPGIIAFPDGSVLHASVLNKAIKSMATHKQYKNMVFYIEACESGSMFENLLPENINVFATTAANSEESSYACYFDKKRDTYLGDVYSVNWMEDSDVEDMTKETLEQQFKIVRKKTNTSHVQEFGNLTMGRLFTIGDFQSEKSSKINMDAKPRKHRVGLRTNPNVGAVKSEDTRMSILKQRIMNENDINKINELKTQIQKLEIMQRKTVGIFAEIVSVVSKNDNGFINQMLTTKKKLANHDCYVPTIDHLLEKCFSSKNEYALRNFYVMVNMCEGGVDSELIKTAIDQVCTERMSDF